MHDLNIDRSKGIQIEDHIFGIFHESCESFDRLGCSFDAVTKQPKLDFASLSGYASEVRAKQQ